MFYSVFQFDDFDIYYNAGKEMFISRAKDLYFCLLLVSKTAGHLC